MIGAICKRDILAHPFVTIHCFGWKVFLRSLVAGRDETFLSIVTRAGVGQVHPGKVPELVERCVQLELRAKRIFERLARRFSERPEVEQFFQSLAVQEQEHADLLRLCRAAGRGRWVERHLDPWQDVIPQLEERMKEAEFSSDSLTSLTDALQLVIEIESSEVNQTFRGVVEAADSDFVRRLRTFQEAMSKHLTYICQGIKTLEPTLEAECDEMLAAYQAGPLQGNASTASSARRPFGDQRA